MNNLLKQQFTTLENTKEPKQIKIALGVIHQLIVDDVNLLSDICRPDKKIFSYQYFWEDSKLESNYKMLFDSEFRLFIMKEFFSQFFIYRQTKKYSRSPKTAKYILIYLADNHPSELMQAIRETMAFTKEQYYTRLEFLAHHKNTELQEFHKAITYLFDIDKSYKSQIKRHTDFIKKIPIYKWLHALGFILFEIIHDLEKDNNGNQLKFLINDYIVICNKILSIKKYEDDYVETKKTTDELNEYFFHLIKKNSVDSDFKKMKKVFNLLFQYGQFKVNKLEYFAYDTNCGVKARKDNTLEIFPIDHQKEKKWERLQIRYDQWLEYYTSQANNLLSHDRKDFDGIAGKTERDKHLNFQHSISTLANTMRISDYGIGENVYTKYGGIRPNRLFGFLNVFAANLKDRVLNNFKDNYVSRYDNYLDGLASMAIKSTFKDALWSTPLRIENFDEFVQITAEIIEVSNKEAESIIRYMTYDFQKNKRTPFDIVETPLLKIGNHLFVIAPFFSEIDMFVPVLNKLLKSFKRNLDKENLKKREKERKEETTTMELNLAKLFIEQGFKAKGNFSICKNGDFDFDCVAFKDNTLFICELKSTYLRLSLSEAHSHLEQSLNKGSKQLVKRIELLNNKENLNRFNEHLNTDISLEDIKSNKVKIHPLIISTSFEFDGEIFNEEYNIRKLSYLELKIILTNTKSFLYPFYQFLLNRFIEMNGEETPMNHIALEQYVSEKMNDENIITEWSDNSILYNELSAQRLIEIIETEEVWNLPIKKNYNPEKKSSLLGGKWSDTEHIKFHNIANDSYQVGDFNKAFDFWNKAIEIYDEDPDYFHGRGNVKAQLKDFNGSLEDFNKAISLNGLNLWSCYMNRGLTYFEMQNYNTALLDLNKAVELKPDVADVYINRATIWAARGDETKFYKDYEKALEIDPKNPKVINAITAQSFHRLFYLEYKNEDVSIDELFERANLKAIIKKDLHDAIKDIRIILEREANNGNAYYTLSFYYQESNDLVKAEECNERAKELIGVDVCYYHNKGMVAIKRKEYPKSLKNFDAAIELDKNDALLFNDRGHLLFQMELFHEAIKDFEVALKLNPNHLISIKNLVASYYQIGKIDLALKYQDLYEKELGKIDMDKWTGIN